MRVDVFGLRNRIKPSIGSMSRFGSAELQTESKLTIILSVSNRIRLKLTA